MPAEISFLVTEATARASFVALARRRWRRRTATPRRGSNKRKASANKRDFITSFAHRLRLPDVSGFRYYPASGGLAYYGVDNIGLWKRAASYLDRILKGEKPASFPVQLPNRYELVINLKTAKTLGLELPPTLLASADEVIQ
jgi:putative tryptophan/tyrosine transport system substrate-binding protein